MGIKIGDISPIAGIATGKGMFGKIADQAGYGLGLIPGALAEQRRKERNMAADAAAAEQAAMEEAAAAEGAASGMKKGGKVRSKKKYASGGTVKSSASKRADGCAQRGKTKGRMV